MAQGFGWNDDGLITKKVENELKIDIPQALKTSLLHIHNFARPRFHPGGWKLYQKIVRHMLWPTRGVDYSATERRCPTCSSNRIKLRENLPEIKLFPAEEPLESNAIDILCELNKMMARGNQYILVISDRCNKLAKRVPMNGFPEDKGAKNFVKECAFNYETPK